MSIMDENKVEVRCDCCGEIIEPGDEIKTRDGEVICHICAEDEYGRCSDCNELVPLDELYDIDGDMVCESCRDNNSHYFYCDHCESWHDDRYMRSYETHEGDTICRSCFREDYFCCNSCEEVYPFDEAEELDGNYYCPDCYESEQRRAKKKIHDYFYKPSPVFKSTHDVFFDAMDVKEPVFGVELEIDKGDDRDDCVAELADNEDVYCKTDGSLGYGVGIEIVSHPCTLEYHLEGLGWDKLMDIARSYGYRSHEAMTCGLHVHIGRQQLADTSNGRREAAAKFVMLVNRFWPELVKFSRRTEDRLNRWAKRPEFEYGYDEAQSIEAALRTKQAGRYQAVNLENRATIELRMFRGTMRLNSFNATLELVSNMTHYIMEHSVEEIMGSQWTDIIEYKHYDDLALYCADKNLSLVPDKPADKFKERPQPLEPGQLVVGLDGAIEGLMGRVVNVVNENFDDPEETWIAVDWAPVQHSLFHTINETLPEPTGYCVVRRRLMIPTAEQIQSYTSAMNMAEEMPF